MAAVTYQDISNVRDLLKIVQEQHIEYEQGALRDKDLVGLAQKAIRQVATQVKNRKLGIEGRHYLDPELIPVAVRGPVLDYYRILGWEARFCPDALDGDYLEFRAPKTQ